MNLTCSKKNLLFQMKNLKLIKKINKLKRKSKNHSKKNSMITMVNNYLNVEKDVDENSFKKLQIFMKIFVKKFFRTKEKYMTQKKQE